MHWRPAFVAPAVAALLACSSQPPNAPTGDGKRQAVVCSGPGICLIKVSDLQGQGCPLSFDGRAAAVHELKVSLTHGTVKIRWVLDPTVSGYRFAASDDFKLRGEASDQFSDPKALSDQAFEVADAVSDGKLYEYALLLHSTAGGDDCLLEAYIKNV